MAFSGHKVYGPTGIGSSTEESFLNEMPPWQGGGDMIRSVSFEETTYRSFRPSLKRVRRTLLVRLHSAA